MECEKRSDIALPLAPRSDRIARRPRVDFLHPRDFGLGCFSFNPPLAYAPSLVYSVVACIHHHLTT
jgi:hypothetical protein